ncbi:MAG TPA: two-component regulator propeller domain-containing protein, partial [Chryseolinea sp.]|nr:two-component regulator propeller domain-containing protein [Chryseolinea sp.]
MSGFLVATLFINLLRADTIPSSPWPYQHVDKRANLSNSAITSVYMDRYDHIWLGTWDGLD